MWLAFSLQTIEFSAFISYFFILGLLTYLSYRRQRSEQEYLLGGRSLNFWLTALSAHASDMGSWLFLGYPALIFTTGMPGAWVAIGLVVCMFFNWHYIAPKLRTMTEQTNSLTLSAYFENRFGDVTGTIRIVAAMVSVLFFTFYISAGLVGLGVIAESLFHLNYTLGISIGMLAVVSYVLTGGYRTIAWIDLFQGFFLLGVIVAVPVILMIKSGGLSPILNMVAAKGIQTSILPNFEPKTILMQLLLALGWGLGYFGQPHILTKFMGIARVSEMIKAKYLGITWQAIVLSAATLIGLIGIALFSTASQDPQRVIIDLVKDSLPAFFSGLVLCAILAATTNVMAAQVLVAASNLSEDFYKRIFHREASSKTLLWASRWGVLFIAMLAFLIAFFKISTIYQLVFYSWSGLGTSFGPLLILSLYRKEITKQGAICGILTGGIASSVWYYYNDRYDWGIPSMVVGFALSMLAIELVSLYTRKKK